MKKMLKKVGQAYRCGEQNKRVFRPLSSFCTLVSTVAVLHGTFYLHLTAPLSPLPHFFVCFSLHVPHGH